MKEIKVIGHKVPDTDCTLSAIIMADFLEKKWYKSEYFIQWKLNKETEFVLDYFWIEVPKIKTSFEAGTRVCLVDHNEKTQSLDNLEELEVEWIVDHHKFDFKSKSPLYIKAEPLCSTGSILYKLYKENNFEISTKIANLILTCILSDSLLFRSATTTKEDTLIAEELKQISDIKNIDEFAMKMFDAKSDLWDISVLDLIKYDYKEFNFNWKKAWIGTLETTNPNYALWRKKEILEWLKTIKENDKLDFIMLSIVDILNEKNTTIILDEDAKIISEVFNTEVNDNLADLKNRLSRKKQIVPELSKYFV